MSCGPCQPCSPPCFTQPENFGLLFPSLRGEMGPPGGPGTYVNSLELLRALDPTSFPDGYMAQVAGYAEPGDGGGGIFQYIVTATADDNDGTIVEPTTGIGRWYRVYSGPVNVKWFGATGDGATDDTNQIQAAIDFIESLATGGQVFLPAGTYYITLALEISGLVGFHMFGEGWGPTGSTIFTDAAINVLEMGSGSADRTVDLKISNLRINGDGVAEIGIVVNRLHQILLDRVRVDACTVAGVDMNMAYNNELRDLYIDDCDRGIIIDENNEYTLIFRCKIFNCGTCGIHFRNGSCSGSKVMFCDIESNEVGIKIDAGSVESVESMAVVGCYFKDQVAENCLFGTDASALWIDSLLFQNNEIKAGTSGPATNNVTFDRCRKPVSMSNTFNDCDVITDVTVVDLLDFGNTYNGSSVPTVVQLGNQGDNLSVQVPSVDPAVTDEVWQNSGVLEVSP